QRQDWDEQRKEDRDHFREWSLPPRFRGCRLRGRVLRLSELLAMDVDPVGMAAGLRLRLAVGVLESQQSFGNEADGHLRVAVNFCAPPSTADFGRLGAAPAPAPASAGDVATLRVRLATGGANSDARRSYPGRSPHRAPRSRPQPRSAKFGSPSPRRNPPPP